VKPAEPVQVQYAQPPPPKGRFRTLRWVWRLTYLSVIGGVVYLGYGVYELRHPDEQPIPDPNKQNLVILGM
jgi:NADH:ubiquinone reductase (non-electrogenic)